MTKGIQQMTVHMFMVKLLGTFSSFSSAGHPTPASSLNSEKKKLLSLFGQISQNQHESPLYRRNRQLELGTHTHTPLACLFKPGPCDLCPPIRGLSECEISPPQLSRQSSYCLRLTPALSMSPPGMGLEPLPASLSASCQPSFPFWCFLI